MTLTTRMVNHIAQRRSDRRASRTRTVVFVTMAAGGALTYTAVNVVWRNIDQWDVTQLDPHGHSQPRGWEVLIEAPTTNPLDVVAYIADTPTATQAAVQAAVKYEVLSRQLLGIAPAGDRWMGHLRRMR